MLNLMKQKKKEKDFTNSSSISTNSNSNSILKSNSNSNNNKLNNSSSSSSSKLILPSNSRSNSSSFLHSNHLNSSRSNTNSYSDGIFHSNSDDNSIYSYNTNTSTISYKTKYEPQKSIHQDIADVFNRPVRPSYSRGHEIPEPHSPHQHSPNYQRPHTSGTKLPPCFSPIRPLEKSRGLYSRATSPVMLRHGRHIPVDMISIKYKYPLNSISYEKPSTLASNIQNASLPSGAESILEDTRFQSIAPFSKRVFILFLLFILLFILFFEIGILSINVC